jgi:peptidoglycan-associated lipoprotein
MMTNVNEQSVLRRGWRSTPYLALVGLLLLTGACSRSLQGNAGSKSFAFGNNTHGHEADRLTDLDASRPGPIPPLSQSRPSDWITAESLSGEQHVTEDPMVAGTIFHDDAQLQAGKDSRSYRDAKQREEGSAAAAAAGLQDVFFAFNSSLISSQASRALLHDATWLRSHPSQTMVIEGHCDERGTLEYNLVLGEKRAKAIRAFLSDQEINDSRVTIVSYGK